MKIGRNKGRGTAGKLAGREWRLLAQIKRENRVIKVITIPTTTNTLMQHPLLLSLIRLADPIQQYLTFKMPRTSCSNLLAAS
jgi:hypothetical protein